MSRMERSSGDLSRTFVGGVMQEVAEGKKDKDGRIFLFVSEDLEGAALDIKPFKPSKSSSIPVHVEVAPNLLMCSCFIVMHGKQVGALHLALVAHCREWLWTKITSRQSVRDVEGSGYVDYIQIMWAISSSFSLYRHVVSNVGLCEYVSTDGSAWDAFWYIYKRGENTPAYSHIGLDTSATLNEQKHVSNRFKELIDHTVQRVASGDVPPLRSTSSSGGFFSRFFK